MSRPNLVAYYSRITNRNTLRKRNDLIAFAEQFLNARLTSLNRDVKICVKNDCAFPAMLYCFATIDLLGALYKGSARSGGTSGNSKYMTRFMRYRKRGIKLLWSIFRHKMVHLAQPKTAILDEDENRIVAWRYEDPSAHHMKLRKLRTPKKIIISTPYEMYCDGTFQISILKLKKDIVDSVRSRKSGYLARLRSSKSLQRNFRKAINEIYNPTITR